MKALFILLLPSLTWAAGKTFDNPDSLAIYNNLDAEEIELPISSGFEKMPHPIHNCNSFEGCNPRNATLSKHKKEISGLNCIKTTTQEYTLAANGDYRPFTTNSAECTIRYHLNTEHVSKIFSKLKTKMEITVLDNRVLKSKILGQVKIEMVDGFSSSNKYFKFYKWKFSSLHQNESENLYHVLNVKEKEMTNATTKSVDGIICTKTYAIYDDEPLKIPYYSCHINSWIDYKFN